MQKVNFNNDYKYPSFLREKLVFDVAGEYFPPVRTVFVNEELIGLYTAVEQPDKNFVEMNDGNYDGNLFKCEKNSDGATGSFCFWFRLFRYGERRLLWILWIEI